MIYYPIPLHRQDVYQTLCEGVRPAPRRAGGRQRGVAADVPDAHRRAARARVRRGVERGGLNPLRREDDGLRWSRT